MKFKKAYGKEPFEPMKPDYDERKNFASGDYYGVGITQPYGKERSSFSNPTAPKGVHVMSASPKKLA